MLKRAQGKKVTVSGGRYVIVASEYNARYVESMVRAAKAVLKESGASGIEVIRVPGSFEIPVVAAVVAGRSEEERPEAILCFGVILRGETTHAEHIARAVTDALVRIQVERGVPVIHEVLLLENEEQAKVRCLSKSHNRGTEAGQTATRMARVMRTL